MYLTESLAKKEEAGIGKKGVNTQDDMGIKDD